MRDGIRYRNDIEFRIKNATIKLEKAIQELNSYKKSTENLETIEDVMISVRRAMGNKEKYRRIQKEREEQRCRNKSFSEYEIDGLIVTDWGRKSGQKTNAFLLINCVK